MLEKLNLYFVINILFSCVRTHVSDTGPWGPLVRKTIEGYLDSVPSLTFKTMKKTLLIMHAFHSSRHLQSKWMLYFSHASMV